MKSYRLIATALLASLAFALQLFNNAIGVQTGFGMTVDLVGVPIILALLLFGYEYALYSLLLVSIFIAFSAPSGYIGASMKFTATAIMLLVPSLYALVMSRDKTLRLVLASGFALLLSILFFALLAYGSTSFSENGFAGTGIGAFLVGILSIILMVFLSYLLLLLWKKFGISSKPFHPSALLALTFIAAILVRGIVMVITNIYFAGPLFFHFTPEQYIGYLTSLDLPLFGKGAIWYSVIFFWNALQGAVEVAIAWLIAFNFKFSAKYGE